MASKIFSFGKYLGKHVFCVQLENRNGIKASFLTYGAAWHSYITWDKYHRPLDVIVSPKDLDGYIMQANGIPYYFGAVIGRHAGRINCVTQNPELHEYLLDCKEGVHLHGGPKGFSQKNWTIKRTTEGEEPSVTFFLESRHMDQGYPGNLLIEVTYSLSNDDSITILYNAKSNKDTLVNLTNHAYFNLGNESLTNQSLYINSNKILEVFPNLIPTGRMLTVQGTPYNFNYYPKLENLEGIDGLDDTFMFNSSSPIGPKVKYSSESTGLEMQIYSDQQAVVVFAPRTMKFKGTPKNAIVDYSNFPSVCFETQFPPDSINHKNFPGCILPKETVYEQRTKYTFQQLLD